MDTSKWTCKERGAFTIITHVNLATMNHTFPPTTQTIWMRNHWRSSANKGSEYFACYEAQVQFTLW
jgi:hypothetical protein